MPHLSSLPELDHVLQFFHTSPLTGILFLPLLFILCDVVTGIGAALKEHRFRWYNLNTYLSTHFRLYVGMVIALAGLALLYDAPIVVSIAGIFGVATLSAEQLASIVHNVRIIAGVEASEVVEQVGDDLLVQYGKTDQPITTSITPASVAVQTTITTTTPAPPSAVPSATPEVPSAPEHLP